MRRAHWSRTACDPERTSPDGSHAARCPNSARGHGRSSSHADARCRGGPCRRGRCRGPSGRADARTRRGRTSCRARCGHSRAGCACRGGASGRCLPSRGHRRPEARTRARNAGRSRRDVPARACLRGSGTPSLPSRSAAVRLRRCRGSRPTRGTGGRRGRRRPVWQPERFPVRRRGSARRRPDGGRASVRRR